MLKRARMVLWVLVAAAAALLSYLTIDWYKNELLASDDAPFGGAFELVSHAGTKVTRDDTLAKPSAFFFGFTHCPDVCPTTLYEASTWLKTLGSDGDNLNVYFVSVDPERDTPEVLADYISSFDDRITGLTGTPEAIEDMLKKYRVYARKVKLEDGDYTVDHTASVYLMKKGGSFFGTIAYQQDSDTAVAKLKRLIES
ncbi:MAG: SCO family protein [Pseudomonadota bacterium]